MENFDIYLALYLNMYERQFKHVLKLLNYFVSNEKIMSYNIISYHYEVIRNGKDKKRGYSW